MSFNGNLEHFPLVDVIQLLHMSSKSGVLSLKSPKGESQLVFREGFFISANHLDNSCRIGKVLLDMNAITKEVLDQALTEQKNAGKERKPLVASLIEQGIIDKESAFKGLETLIEMTIVEVLTWENGTFSLDVAKEYISDEYRYFPEKLNRVFLLNAQGILMDSLRIYDEKMRDGTLSDIFFAEESNNKTFSTGSSAPNGITADMLGLDALDTIPHKIQEVFIGLKDYDPRDEHSKAVTRALPDATKNQQDRLITFLTNISTQSTAESSPPVTAIILLSKNELLSHAVTTLCKQINLFIFASDEEIGLDVVIEQSLGRDLHPVLVIDMDHDIKESDVLALVQKKVAAYPQLSILITACCQTWQTICMDAIGSGTRAIIPRPCIYCHKDSYIDQMMTFLSGIGPYLKRILPVPQADVGQHFIMALHQLKSLSEPPAIALVMLQFAALQFERALTFVVSRRELIAERSLGISTSKYDGPSGPLMFRIPMEANSVLQEVVEKGKFYYGQKSDAVLTERLYKEIGQPRSPKMVAVPLISRGKVIAVTYADFGSKPVSPPQINLLEALAQLAGSALDNALYRKSIEKT